MANRNAFLTAMFAIALAGCNSAPAPAPVAKTAPAEPIKPTISYPSRPTVAPPAFTMFHFNPDSSSFTLVTKETASDEEIEAIVWQVRDAARANKLSSLKLKLPDNTNDFHANIYRGKKCAAEKYQGGQPPCGPSYHAAGDYTLSKLPNRIWDKGALRSAEGKETPLWDSEAPYTPSK